MYSSSHPFFLIARTVLLGALVAVIVFAATAGAASAQGRNAAGVGIRPANIEPSTALDPGETLTRTLTLNNYSGEDQTFYLFVRDITGTRAGGVPVFAPDDQERTGYELSSWVTLEQTSIDVPAEGSGQVDIAITVPENASPGSHFGGVFVSVDPPELRESGAAVGYQVANIITLLVSGEATESASIRQFSTGQYVYGASTVDFQVRIENSGNVLVRPTGPLEIKNMFGTEVGKLTFNENRSGVFPGSQRTFDITWEYAGTGFGRYEAIVSPIYGTAGKNQTMSSTVTFWILPMNIILPAAGVLALILLVTYVAIKLYVRRAVAELSGRRVGRRRRKQRSSATLAIVISLLVVTALFLIVLLLLFA